MIASENNSATETASTPSQVVILGGGATGFYTARSLMNEGYQVLMINRDHAIGGGTRYFIRYDKDKKMKLGLLRAFSKILDDPNFIGYYGGLSVGGGHDLTLEDLLSLEPNALVLATGSRGSKPLSIKGIELLGVHNAYDVAQCYNQAPGYKDYQLHIGEHVAILGMGNVTADMIYWLTHEKQDVVKEITVFARRGPFEFKMKHPEVKELIDTIDPIKLDLELKRVLHVIYEEQKEMEAEGQSLPYFLDIIIDSDTGGVVLDERTKEPKVNEHKLTGSLEKDVTTLMHNMLIPEEKINFIKNVALGKETFNPTGPTVSFHFLTQPEELERNEKNQLAKIHLSHNKLVLGTKSGRVKALKIECDNKTIPIDTFIYSIGSVINPELGLETEKGWPVPIPNFPYRLVYKERLIWAFGWARRPSSGLVGEAKQDVANGIWDLMGHLKEIFHKKTQTQTNLEALLKERGLTYTNKEQITQLHKKELEEKRLLSSEEIQAHLNKVPVQTNL